MMKLQSVTHQAVPRAPSDNATILCNNLQISTQICTLMIGFLYSEIDRQTDNRLSTSSQSRGVPIYRGRRRRQQVDGPKTFPLGK